MSAETDAFEKELWAEALEIHEKIKDGIITIAEDLFHRILRRTPFQTGYLLANWQIGETSQTRSRVKLKARTRKASITRQGATARAIESLTRYMQALSDPFAEIRIVNTAPYASFVHEKSGGPHLEDLVELSVQEVNARTYEVY